MLPWWCSVELPTEPARTHLHTSAFLHQHAEPRHKKLSASWRRSVLAEAAARMRWQLLSSAWVAPAHTTATTTAAAAVSNIIKRYVSQSGTAPALLAARKGRGDLTRPWFVHTTAAPFLPRLVSTRSALHTTPREERCCRLVACHRGPPPRLRTPPQQASKRCDRVVLVVL